MDKLKHQTAMKTLFDLLERRWVTQELDDSSYSFEYLAGPIPFSCYVEINPKMEGVLFRAILGGAPLPKESFESMERLCTLHNLQLPNGCFAFNPQSGEVRFKFGAYFWKQDLTEQMLRNVLEPAIQLLDAHVLSIVSVYAGKPLSEALTRTGENPGIGTSSRCHYKHEPHPGEV